MTCDVCLKKGCSWEKHNYLWSYEEHKQEGKTSRELDKIEYLQTWLVVREYRKGKAVYGIFKHELVDGKIKWNDADIIGIEETPGKIFRTLEEQNVEVFKVNSQDWIYFDLIGRKRK